MTLRPDFEILRHSLLIVAGHRYWVLPLLPMLWLGFHALLILNDPSNAFSGSEVQDALLALPLTGLAVFLGMRIIAGEIDDRSLEIAYTVPGGCERLWYTKLVAAFLVLLVAEALLAGLVFVFFTPFPPGALYGAMQPACFYLILAMAMGTLFRSEAAGAIATIAILGLNGLITGMGSNQLRGSPFYNPYIIEEQGGFTSPAELMAWTLQNHVGIFLVTVAIAALAFMRANRRERMLGSD